MVSACVRFTVPGFHRWPGAPDGRGYLRNRHRHLFHCEVRVRVEHDDRDIEFHDLLDVARAGLLATADAPPEWAPGVAVSFFGTASCETLARRLLDVVNAKWPGRAYHAEVWEDGEAGAVVTV